MACRFGLVGDFDNLKLAHAAIRQRPVNAVSDSTAQKRGAQWGHNRNPALLQVHPSRVHKGKGPFLTRLNFSNPYVRMHRYHVGRHRLCRNDRGAIQFPLQPTQTILVKLEQERATKTSSRKRSKSTSVT